MKSRTPREALRHNGWGSAETRRVKLEATRSFHSLLRQRLRLIARSLLKFSIWLAAHTIPAPPLPHWCLPASPSIPFVLLCTKN
ncbi:hypothetical protein E2C01_062548 [Portunus trituberculatus]|uniref:Uncharacterized protein n=1 Tax=Portunus trituberculatus TaxID=210409 RepID=A0A5B7HHL5_PORTR|nr:hypothetical protein [Portunus trituberculatus]